MRHRGRWKALALATVALLTLPGAALAIDEPAAAKQVDRSKLAESFRNTGQAGGTFDGTSYTGRHANSMNYPYVFSGSQDGRAFSSSHDNDNSHGQAIWILAKDEAGNLYITSSGWSYNTDDVDQEVPDFGTNLKDDLLKGIGYDTKDANAWGKADRPLNTAQRLRPIAQEPVEVDNYRENGQYTTPEWDHFPEETVISRWKSREVGKLSTATGMTMTRKAYGWSNQDFDDFFLTELTVENTSSRDYPEVYVAYFNYFGVSYPGHSYRKWNGWWFSEPGRKLEDDRYQFTEASNYTGAGKGLKLSYQYDEDTPFSSENDRGEPRYPGFAAGVEGWRGDGELMAYQYIGMAPVDVTPPFINDPKVDYAPPEGAVAGGEDLPAAQPRYAHWWKKRSLNPPEFEPHKEIDTVKGMFDKFVTPGKPFDDNPVDGGPKVEERFAQEQSHAQVYGPYRLLKGQKAKLVMAYAAGAASEVAGPGGEPMDERAWALTSGAQSQLANGEQVLFNHLARARLAYRMGYDVPNPPPDVPGIAKSVSQGTLPGIQLTATSGGNAQLTWTDLTDSATNPGYTGAEASDIAGYRVYSATSVFSTDPVRHSGNYGGPWRVIADIPVRSARHYKAGSGNEPGIYTFVDENSVTGFQYWYNVSAYAKGHAAWENTNAQKNAPAGAQVPVKVKLADLPKVVQGHMTKGLEGSHLVEAARHRTDGRSFSPFIAASDPADRLERKVIVVPNPWKDDGVHSFGAQGDNNRNLRFTNVPRMARITIYNAAGDIMHQIVHNGTLSAQHAAELTWGQNTWTGASVIPAGAYFFSVESLVPGSIGKVQRGSFIVIK